MWRNHDCDLRWLYHYLMLGVAVALLVQMGHHPSTHMRNRKATHAVLTDRLPEITPKYRTVHLALYDDTELSSHTNGHCTPSVEVIGRPKLEPYGYFLKFTWRCMY